LLKEKFLKGFVMKTGFLGETEVLISYIEAVKSYKTLVLLFEVVFCVFLEAWSLLEAVKSYKTLSFLFFFLI
jgi:hypothetical protein